MNRINLLLLACSLTASQVAVVASENQSVSIAPASKSAIEENKIPELKAMQGTVAPAKAVDTTTTLSAPVPNKNQTMFQFMLNVPCAGWNTVAIILSGFPSKQASPSAEPQSNNFIEPDLLKEFSCKQLAKRVLRRGQRQIIMEAYLFDTTEGAYGVYCAAHHGSSSYLPHGDASSEDQDSVSFCKDKYFVYLSSTSTDDDEAKSAISKLAKQLIDNANEMKQNQDLYSRTKPVIFDSMPSLERLSGSERIVMGPIGLKRFFPAPYSANLAPLLAGAIADYKFDYPDRDRVKLLIANYRSNIEAVQTFDKYVETLRSIHKEKPVEGFSAPTNLFKLSNCFLLCQLKDKKIIVINGARHKESLSDLAHRIYY